VFKTSFKENIMNENIITSLKQVQTNLREQLPLGNSLFICRELMQIYDVKDISDTSTHPPEFAILINIIQQEVPPHTFYTLESYLNSKAMHKINWCRLVNKDISVQVRLAWLDAMIAAFQENEIVTKVEVPYQDFIGQFKIEVEEELSD
jgi:hypothetical protein